MNLQCFIGHCNSIFGCIIFGHCSQLADILSTLSEISRLECQHLCCFRGCCNICKIPLDTLISRNWFLKLNTFFGISNCQINRTFRNTYRL